MSDNSQNKSWLLYALLACSLVLNVMLLLNRGSSDEAVGVASIEGRETQAASSPADDAPAADAAADDDSQDDVAPPAAANAAKGSAPMAGWNILRGKVDQSLARTFQVEAGEAGDALTSVYTRLFVWDLDLRRDLQKGDSIAVAWRPGADGIPEVAAGSLQTKKLGKTVTAYRWKAPGDEYASYWRLDGTESALRLKEGPLAQYEQITSLLKDRPTHKGMDFKTPVGTEVITPRAGTVTRVNWNWGANGNCVEIRYDDGVLAKFLHLSENRVKEGERVKVGQVIALSGNTGHSTAPHLHYQLDRADKTIDPLDYHGTIRRSLDDDKIGALKRDVAELETMMTGAAG